MTLCLATPSRRCQRTAAGLLFRPAQEIAELALKSSDEPLGWVDGDRRALPQMPGNEECISDRQTAERAVRALRVLLVDDNRCLAELTAMLLRSDGHSVEIAGDAASALECVRAYQPEIIFTDIKLPGMSGCTLASRLRASEDTKHVFLAAVTGYPLEDYHEAGFDCHLVKPVEPIVLRRLLLSVANGRT
jgi:CheY-like chemotaxis protein